MIKSLDTKLADIHADPSGSKAFIIADAKDADMAFGITSPGPRREAEIPAFVNDHIIRSLAGVTKCGRPLFLKIAYNGPKALSELVNYDPQLIVGILGGGAGTTYDAFKLIADAQTYGARVA